MLYLIRDINHWKNKKKSSIRTMSNIYDIKGGAVFTQTEKNTK